MSNLIYIATQDNRAIDNYQLLLEAKGYMVQFFKNSDELFNIIQRQKCNLAIMDIDAAHSNHLLICTKIRKLSNLPIVLFLVYPTHNKFLCSNGLF